MARTPRGANASDASSETRGMANAPGGRTVSSVETRPGCRSATPDVAISGLPEPASVSPSASMARLSIALFSANFEKSWMKAQWMTPSDPAAPRLRLSTSSSDPRWTSAPAAASLSADASDRARPRTEWPAPRRSATMAEPTKPLAPVTKMRMEISFPDVKGNSLGSGRAAICGA